ncbi:peptidase domain-containing ABC transporter [Aquimarina sp. RZ0]|uniref:peptidase domain-containing ABC transporter n=1 Tax=Aquimarina sp. RZ0 TaxID=2607730 RepID=UPI0011F1A34C|nr:peptidase domain-containing ABC transporter [Aquimarina sp. RZ0]KAA1244086.1 peptidase domain-containing ABC transporter [Aquimarina sp. RZ0]
MKFIGQHDQTDCGPASLAMIAQYYGKKYTLDYLRNLSFISREGVSLLGVNEAALKIGLETFPSQLSIEELRQKAHLPCILHWNKNHFVVLFKIKKRLLSKEYVYKLADPGYGIISLSESEFSKHWLSNESKGVALFLSPTDTFYDSDPPKEEKISLKYMISYLYPYKKQLFLMFGLLLAGSGLTLIFPFLTQQLIDKGVHTKNIHNITIILLAQLVVFLGSISIEIVRNWLVLFVGTKLSITVVSDFLKKMLQLPIAFFDSKMVGDFNQRIQDNDRIEDFLTSQSLMTIFSMITFTVFFGVLWYYDYKIVLTYVVLTALAIAWSGYWLKKRKHLDYFRFQQKSKSHESIFEMINGVTALKLNQFDEYKRKEWEHIQENLFKINIRILKLDQFQFSGFQFINEIKNIFVTFLAATYVVYGKMTLGELMSVAYIIGQMNSPVNQLINFFRSLQDAKLSLERLNEVQNHPEEETENQVSLLKNDLATAYNEKSGINIENVSFQYEGPKSPYVLKDINVWIPEGKITAIVGASGSGKTTLMKLLLKFYKPTEGTIYYNAIDLQKLSPKNLRKHCGIVMQDGYIFSDSIKRNIATGAKDIDPNRLKKSATIANIESFIESLPLKYNTKIGTAGNGMSGGQKQRILISRAVYRNPHYIFFDEATSALDAENEKIIHDNLQQFFKGKTVVIIAHRLSTVKNADQIIVLKKGQIVEKGNHKELVNNKSEYYNLVKNQLELGS